MKVNRPIAFVALAFVIGATISQGSFAFADDSSTNPFRAIWQAIGELQTKTDSLQSQINDLKAQQNSPSATPLSGQIATKVSETSLAIDLSSGQAGQTLINLVAKNAGPDSAVGVKLSTYYQMSLFQVNHIDGAQCTDQARGIIECYLGTIESGGEARITIDATPVQLGQQAIITADVSSITKDSNPGNNHAETVFVTSQALVAIPPAQQQPTTVVPPVEQPNASNQTSAEQPVQNQTSVQTPTEQPSVGNQTGTQETQSGQQAPPTEQAPQPGGEQATSGNEGTNSSSTGSGSGGESSSGSSSSTSSSDTGTSSGGTGSSSSDSSSQSSSSSTGSDSTASSSSGGSSDSSGRGASSSTGGESSSSGESGSSSSGDAGSSGGSSATG